MYAIEKIKGISMIAFLWIVLSGSIRVANASPELGKFVVGVDPNCQRALKLGQ